MTTRSIARRVAIATAIVALAALPALSLAASPVAAAGPTAAPTAAPTEMVLNPPQYLLWWDHHATMNGDVVDHMYRLYTAPPDANGNFTVPDGSGGVFHYVGRLVGGPYTTDTQLCPVMSQLGIKSLDLWPPGEYSPTVTCSRFGAAPAASGASASPGGSGSNGSNGSGGSQSPGNSDEAQILAEALIGVLLFGGGLAGLARLLGLGRGTPAGSPAVQPRQGPPPDPCSMPLAEYLAASEEARAIQAMLVPARAAAAMLEQRIAWIANIKFPGSVGIDLAFLAGTVYSGGLAELATRKGWGLLGRKFLVAQTIKQVAVEGVVKELIKSFGKRLTAEAGAAGINLDSLVADVMRQGPGGGAKSALKEVIKRTIVNGQQGALSLHPPVVISNLPTGSVLRWKLDRLAGYQAVADPIADGVANALSVANAVWGAGTIYNQLELLRIQRDRILDQAADLEMSLESALERQNWTRERLNSCRSVWAGGRP